MAKSSIHIKASKKGTLHTALGVKQGEKIPSSKLQIHPGDSPSLRKKKQFAINAKKWHHAEDGMDIDPNTLTRSFGPQFQQLPSFQYQGVQNPQFSPITQNQEQGFTNTVQGTPNNTNWVQTGVSGLNLLDAFLPYQKMQPRVNRLPVYNPHQYGTGSQAIYDAGGMIGPGRGDLPSYYGLHAPVLPLPPMGASGLNKSQQALEASQPWMAITKELAELQNSYQTQYNAIYNRGMEQKWNPKKLEKELQKGTGGLQQQIRELKGKMPTKYAEGGDLPGKAVPVYKTQAEVDQANMFAKNFERLHPNARRLINPEDVWVAKKPGDPMVPFVDPSGLPYTGKPSRPKAFNVPNDISLEDIKGDGMGGFYYEDPHSGNVVDIDSSVLNSPRFRKPQEQINSDMAARTAQQNPSLSRQYKQGGIISGKKGQEKQADDGTSISPLSENLFQFNGPSHEQGGIPISYGGKKVEVEGQETGLIQPGGDMTIFGNMTNPLTGKKFKQDSKALAKKQQKVEKLLDKGTSLVNSSNPQDKWEELSFNAGRVMMQGAERKKQEIQDSTQHLANLQEALLQVAHENSLDPQSFSKGKMVKAKKGINIKADGGRKVPVYDPSFIDYTKLAKKGIPQVSTEMGDVNAMVRDSPFRKQYSADNYYPTSSQQEESGLSLDYQPLPSHPFTNARGLDATQILPELHALATNQVQPVHLQQFSPQLQQPYQVSFRDQLNENQAGFNALQHTLADNPSALSTLAGQAYQANSSVLGAEFRTNQQITQDIHNKNTQLLNEATLKNLELSDQQYTRQAQAKSNTKALNNTILNSIAGKIKQNQLEQQTIKFYENMYPYYRFDPTTGESLYTGPDGASQIGLGSGMGTGAANTANTVKRDKNGNVLYTLNRSSSPLQTQKQVLQNTKLQRQMMLHPFPVNKENGGLISLEKLVKTKNR